MWDGELAECFGAVGEGEKAIFRVKHIPTVGKHPHSSSWYIENFLLNFKTRRVEINLRNSSIPVLEIEDSEARRNKRRGSPSALKGSWSRILSEKT